MFRIILPLRDTPIQVQNIELSFLGVERVRRTRVASYLHLNQLLDPVRNDKGVDWDMKPWVLEGLEESTADRAL